MATKEQQHTFVTRERVIAPPDRFIFGVQDDELIEYFQGAPVGQPGWAAANGRWSYPQATCCAGFTCEGYILLPPCVSPAEVFGSELAPALPVLHQLIEGICTADFTALRRSVPPIFIPPSQPFTRFLQALTVYLNCTHISKLQTNEPRFSACLRACMLVCVQTPARRLRVLWGGG